MRNAASDLSVIIQSSCVLAGFGKLYRPKVKHDKRKMKQASSTSRQSEASSKDEREVGDEQ